LSQDELTIFASIVGLWQGMVTGYQRCLQACMAGDAQLAAYGALLCHRCLLYSGLQISEFLRTGYEFDSKLWRQLHQIYAFCEGKNWQLKSVNDDLNGVSRTTSCNATYIKTLLAYHAYRAELSRNLLHLMDRWLTLWSPTVTVERRYTVSKGDAPSLAVDLDSASGLQVPQLPSPSDHLRYLVMAPLSKLMRVKTILLQQGQLPQQLELGEGCNSAECIAFLGYLHKHWCEGYDGRMDERHSAIQQQAQVCYGMESCFAYIANRPFKQPARDAAADTLSRKQIAAFGRVLSDTNRHDLAVMGMVLETWQIEDESIRGARLLREGNAGVRLGPGQLIAVRPTNANAFMVGTVSWVKVTQTGQLHIGVRYQPGLPQTVSMKATGINLSVSDKYVAALLLPTIPELKIPASLIAPRDWFKPGRVVEIVQVDKKKLQLKMELSIEKSSDYERISFTEI
jgi:cyclic-di-GMP-binding protein